MEPYSGVVLTGGQSRRMGTDKALVEVDGRPMAVRVADALRAAGADEVLAVGGDLDGLRAAGLDARPDPRQGEGPLAGILSAFAVTRHDLVVILATDLAWIEPGVVRVLLSAAHAEPGRAPAVAVARTDRLEPLCAAWRVSRCRPVIEALYDAGERAVHRALAHLDAVDVAVPPRAVANANTPEDLVASLKHVGVPEISVGELADRMAAGAFVLDVRQPDEYVEAHVPGAVLVPLDQVPARAGELPTDTEILVICRSGARSHRAAEYLIDQHHLTAVNVAGGTLAWIESGRDIVVGSEPT
jgi:molybdopterin-guanine dinucleotide biosynthesis protein A/rhodanese-related sulfurtransferase